MKPLFWNRIPDKKIGGTFWDSITDEGVQLDIPRLVFDFSRNAKAGASGKGKRAKAATTKSSARKVVSLLDHKRQQNGGIALARLGISFTAVSKALLEMDEELLSPDTVEMLLRLAPSSEETCILQDFAANNAKGDKLAKLDTFLLALSSLKRFKERLACLASIRAFEKCIPAIGASLGCLRVSVRELGSSPAIREMFRFVLALGNYVNGGTNRGVSERSVVCMM
jgi:diaphanous 1